VTNTLATIVGCDESDQPTSLLQVDVTKVTNTLAYYTFALFPSLLSLTVSLDFLLIKLNFYFYFCKKMFLKLVAFAEKNETKGEGGSLFLLILGNCCSKVSLDIKTFYLLLVAGNPG
jgi:hypothetical protein